LYGCGNVSLTLRTGHRFRVYENGVQRRIFAHQWGEVTGCWRRLHNEELHMYTSPSIIRSIKSRRMRRTRHVACMGEMRNIYKIYVEEHEGK